MSLPDATHAFYFPDSLALVRFGKTGPQPQFLLDSQRLKVLLAGLAPGQQIPPHAEALAVYHVLAGRGVMTVDGEPLPVGPGSTIIALEGATRGLVAETPLVFLAAKAG
jgi:quercetin dioxygenase-like cupin family protein